MLVMRLSVTVQPPSPCHVSWRMERADPSRQCVRSSMTRLAAIAIAIATPPDTRTGQPAPTTTTATPATPWAHTRNHSQNDCGSTTRSMRGSEAFDNDTTGSVWRNGAACQQIEQRRVWQFQQGLESGLLVCACSIIATREKPLQQHVKLFHPPPTTPFQLPWVYFIRAQLRRSASNFLVLAMALAGFSPLGHTRAQLPIVWHRYNLNGSSSESSRSSVASSRLSTNQR